MLIGSAASALRERIEELGPWFHNLRLDGLQTAPDHFLGDYPAFKWQCFADALPHDLTGCTVLDIGCNGGFYALEMKRRGADRVVAIDSDERYLRQAALAAEVTGLSIELHHMSVYEIARLGRRFDLVLFMGVLYHLRHPLLALDLIRAHVAGDLLVCQSLQRGSPTAAAVAEDYPFEETEVFLRTGRAAHAVRRASLRRRPHQLVDSQCALHGSDATQRRLSYRVPQGHATSMFAAVPHPMHTQSRRLDCGERAASDRNGTVAQDMGGW